MKLKFEKSEIGETIVTVDGKNFVSQNYIELIKQLYAGTEVEVEFGEDITTEEQNSINEMVKTINTIDTKTEVTKNNEVADVTPDYPEEEINPEDIPF